MPAEAQDRLRAFDQVEVRAEATDLERRRGPAGPAPLVVLAEGADWLVVDKPAGIPTVPDRAGATGVHGRLQELRPDADLRIVHRLDRDTSGCLLLAAGADAARHFDAEFRARRVAKGYTALVHGALRAVEVELWLGPDPRRPGKMVAARTARKGFRSARTTVRVVEPFVGFTLVDLQPHTGRSHQLRVHLQALGHPIVGDVDYGGRPLLLSELKRGYKLRRGLAERPVLQRMFLHSERIRFRGPDGRDTAVTAPLPEALRLALAKVARFASAPGSSPRDAGAAPAPE
ncbi:MAG: RluA family pseudouridine synthase [Planctomycetota bacterium]